MAEPKFQPFTRPLCPWRVSAVCWSYPTGLTSTGNGWTSGNQSMLLSYLTWSIARKELRGQSQGPVRLLFSQYLCVPGEPSSLFFVRKCWSYFPSTVRNGPCGHEWVATVLLWQKQVRDRTTENRKCAWRRVSSSPCPASPSPSPAWLPPSPSHLYKSFYLVTNNKRAKLFQEKF